MYVNTAKIIKIKGIFNSQMALNSYALFYLIDNKDYTVLDPEAYKS